ncbi:MAG TPA: amino acid adenylation domain-containing protein, partial [Longimicrobiaceae bacterium]|nr:amino acid adenylation domain-containing protein [Longimicrobiaceae bacterium]
MSDSTTTHAPSAEEKRRRLAALLQKKVAEPRVHPTSFLQQRLWFLDLLEPGSPVYNVSTAIRLRGPLQPDALDRALGEVARRHEALRTSIRVQDGEAVQVVDPHPALRVEMEDLTAWTDADEREEELQRRLSVLGAEPFDLSRAPLFRARLYRESEESHVLAYTVHHAISDGWSLGMFSGELTTLYEAFRQGQPSPLPPVGLQYTDFARWQREQYDGGALADQLRFWTETLGGAPAATELPLDRPRPPTQDYAGAKLFAELGRELTDRVAALARREGATTYMALLAGFSALLHRYTGETDVVVGTPIAGRTRPELERVFGYFANTLALRTDLSADPTFRELVGRVRGVLLGAYANQDFPFEKLVDELKVERSTAYNPLFQVLFVLQNAPSEAKEMEDVSARAMSVPSTTSMFDLMWQLFEGEPGTLMQVEYRTGLFDEATVLRMAHHLERLLTAAVDAPDAPISTLDFMLDEERAQVLGEWNATAAEGRDGQVVPDLFAAQAARTPHAPALRHAGRTLTYAEVDARAHALARRLRALGVGPETRVGVCLGRGVDTPVAILAVLRAGGCYVAMDPAYPADRLAYMLEDSRAAVLVTTAEIAGTLPEHGASVVLLDGVDLDASDGDGEPVRCPALPDNPAYVLYTSGSTGRPKGVVLPHRALVNLLHWQAERWAGQAPAVTLQFASLSFDVSFQEIFSTWATGGTLVLVDEDTRRDAEALLAHVRAEGVERLFLPFAALDALAEVADGPALHGVRLREIITAGEQLQSTPALRRLAMATGCRVDNQYGPSETHVVSAYRLPEDAAAWSLLPPIGAPIANTRLYVLDGNLRPAVLGASGELCVGGDGLARGYHGRPALTAEKFIPDAVSGIAGARLYRTGDRVRWLA